MIRRLQTLPAAADAEDGSLYLEINSNGRILRRLLKDYRLSAFFDITVADLGDGHLGYAGAGYDGLGSSYAVNAGGSSQYSGIGAISEQFKNLVSSTFTRVGTYTVGNNPQGLAARSGDTDNLYLVRAISVNSYVQPFNISSGTLGTLSTHLANVSAPQGLTILNGIAYTYGGSQFRAYDIDANSWTTLTTAHTGVIGTTDGMANANGIVYVVYFASDGASSAIAQVNTSTGALSNIQTLSGFESDDAHNNVSGVVAINNNIYVSTNDTNNTNPHLYEVNPSNGNLTTIGNISPSNADMRHLAPLGGYIYGWNDQDNGIYQAQAAQGNRWVATFPSTTTEVAADETTLKLFTERGGTEIELTKDDNITTALVFASDYDGAAAHTISVGDTPEWALYNSSDEQLYEGSAEAIYSELAAA